MFKKLIFLIFIFCFFFIAPLAHADEGWTIDNFQSDVTIQSDGKVNVVETIAVDFGSLVKHGIYRDIPNIYYNENNAASYADIQIASVLQDGISKQYEQSQNGNFLRLVIGDPNRTFSGKAEYKISYLESGVLRSFADHDELYLDITGNGWPVPIAKATVNVTLPKDGITSTLCFQGPQGSNEKCTATVPSQNSASFSSIRQLGVNEGMTIVLGYQKGMVPILHVANPQPAQTTTSYTSENFAIDLVAFFVTLLLGTAVPIFLWFKHGRDEKGSRTETIMVEYKAPDNLRPAEVGTVLDERADTLDVTATIVDLAARGFLTIKEEEKKWLFGSTDYVLTKKQKDTKVLLEYEKMLFDKLFADGDSVKMSDLQTKFYKTLVEIKSALYKDVVDKKYFSQSPETVRGQYVGLGIAIIIIGGVLAFVFSALSGTILAISLGLVASGVVFLLFANNMPKRTTQGFATYQKILGFKLFIDKAETYRQQFFERENLFNEILPYAIVFGATEKLAKAFQNMGLKPPQPDWYISNHAFNYMLFSSNLNSFSNSLGSAIASQPHRNSFASSGSGFSGGFSGGGFGGGGGGSW